MKSDSVLLLIVAFALGFIANRCMSHQNVLTGDIEEGSGDVEEDSGDAMSSSRSVTPAPWLTPLTAVWLGYFLAWALIEIFRAVFPKQERAVPPPS